MGTVREAIDDRLAAFLDAQHVFFVGTAPTGAEGHVNVSPKGGPGMFAVLGPHRVAYLDLTGSGAETLAHLRDNGRITLMFCAFEGPPKIVRLHGRGRAVLPGDPDWAELAGRFPSHRGARAVVDVEVERVSDSCGYAVPLMRFEGERGLLDEWTARRSDEDISAYQRRKNAESIDGLPALPTVPAQDQRETTSPSP